MKRNQTVFGTSVLRFLHFIYVIFFAGIIYKIKKSRLVIDSKTLKVLNLLAIVCCLGIFYSTLSFIGEYCAIGNITPGWHTHFRITLFILSICSLVVLHMIKDIRILLNS